LAAELQNHPEVDREAIIELADELLQEMT
jgi:hypothetical protein